MKLTLLGPLAAAAALSVSGFVITVATAPSDHEPMHAELVQRWAEAALDA